MVAEFQEWLFILKGLRQENGEFKTNLGYITSSGPACITHEHITLNNNNNNRPGLVAQTFKPRTQDVEAETGGSI